MKKHNWKWFDYADTFHCIDCNTRTSLRGRRGSPERFDNHERILSRTDCDSIIVEKAVKRLIGI